jgi:glucose/arabinose dehydrogenase
MYRPFPKMASEGVISKRRVNMFKPFLLGASLLAFGAAGALAAESTSPDKAAEMSGTGAGAGATLIGQAAFTGWEENKPGVTRLIRPEDLPEPSLGEEVDNPPEVTALPDGGEPAVPVGFDVEMVADGFEQPRVIRTAPNGDLFVADSKANTVHVIRLKDGSATPVENSVFASGLNRPYGIAFYPLGPNPEWVYIANADRVIRFAYKNGDLEASGEPETIIEDIPTDRHWTRDIVFSPDGNRMFLAVGSGSNIAEQVTELPEDGIDSFAADHAMGAMWGAELDRANVLAFDADGADKQVFATGLRNCSGMTIQPGSGALWCVVNERDGLGDNLPPDYATVVAEGAFYGWPWFYIGDHEDPRPPLKGQRPDLAGKVTVPDVLFQAHSAPLNITFYEGGMFPAEYRGDAFVTMHGSWNRGNRTGYKVVRMLMDDQGKPTGEYQDFMTGFVISDGAVWGRPVGLAVAQDGSLIVTEDGSGTIWRVSHEASPS